MLIVHNLLWAIAFPEVVSFPDPSHLGKGLVTFDRFSWSRGPEEVRQGQRLRNTHVTTRIPKPHTTRVLFMCVGRYARHVNYPRVTIRQPNFTGQFLALLTGYAKTVLSHD